MPLIPGLLRPGLCNLPIGSELRARADHSSKCLFEAGDLHQILQFVRIARKDPFLLRKLVSFRFLRNTSLQRALDRIASQVIRPVSHPALRSAFASFSRTFDNSCKPLRSTRLHHRPTTASRAFTDALNASSPMESRLI